MYRQIFIPSEQNANITIPREWYGQLVEVIVFPVNSQENAQPQQNTLEEKREKLDKLLDNHLIDLSDFKFNRDEANDYE
jgi:hypothetical protein